MAEPLPLLFEEFVSGDRQWRRRPFADGHRSEIAGGGFLGVDGQGFDLAQAFIVLVVPLASYREPLPEFSAARFPYRRVHDVSWRRVGSFFAGGEIGLG